MHAAPVHAMQTESEHTGLIRESERFGALLAIEVDQCSTTPQLNIRAEPEMSPPKFQRMLEIEYLDVRKGQALRAIREEVPGSSIASAGPQCTEPETSPPKFKRSKHLMLKSEPEMSPPKFKRKLRLGRLEMRKKQTLRASGEEVQGSTTEGPKCTEPEASPASPCKRPTSAIWDGGGHAAQAYATAPECCDYAALQESSTLLPPERTETDKEAIKEGRDGEEGEGELCARVMCRAEASSEEVRAKARIPAVQPKMMRGREQEKSTVCSELSPRKENIKEVSSSGSTSPRCIG